MLQAEGKLKTKQPTQQSSETTEKLLATTSLHGLYVEQ